MFKNLIVLIAAACLPAGLLADFSYDSSTKVTGGALAGMMKFAGAFSKQAREPIQSTVAIKGNRMLNASKDHASIIDLDSETITDVNFQKKTYSVITFAQMKQLMQQAAQQMTGRHTDDKGNTVTTDLKFDVKDSGETRQISGFDAKKLVMTMQMDATDDKSGRKGGMQVVSDLWIASNVPGYGEVREFHKKMAQKLDWSPDSSALAMGRPDVARGMASVYKEAAKMDGVPVMTVMKMMPTADGQPVSAADNSGSQQPQSKPNTPPPSLSGVLGSKLGGFGGFGRKKKQEAQSDTPSSTPAPQSESSPGSLLEMTTEMNNFSSSPVDPSKFSVPSGFKQIEPEMSRRPRQ